MALIERGQIREYPNPYPQQWASFSRYAAEHELSVLHEDGLNRRLRMRTPSQGSVWSWEIITWPGHLATAGDIGCGYVFSREADMLDFFRMGSRNRYSDGSPWIDFRYWAEKLQGPGAAYKVKTYSSEKFLQHIMEALSEDEKIGETAQALRAAQLEWLDLVYEDSALDPQDRLHQHWAGELSASALWCPEDIEDDKYFALVEELAKEHGSGDGLWFDAYDLDVPEASPQERVAEIMAEARDASDYEESARSWLQEDDQVELFGSDTWEWDFTDYDSHFVFACYAIHQTVTQWYAHQEERAREERSSKRAAARSLIRSRR